MFIDSQTFEHFASNKLSIQGPRLLDMPPTPSISEILAANLADALAAAGLFFYAARSKF
jgi:hypothetical protein